jgi:hypothetical protein
LFSSINSLIVCGCLLALSSFSRFNNEPLPLNNNAISIVGENAQAIAMQQAINESMNSHADAVAFQAPPGWGNIDAKAIQLQNLEKELNANRQPQTISELIDGS